MACFAGLHNSDDPYGYPPSKGCPVLLLLTLYLSCSLAYPALSWFPPSYFEFLFPAIIGLSYLYPAFKFVELSGSLRGRLLNPSCTAHPGLFERIVTQQWALSLLLTSVDQWQKYLMWRTTKLCLAVSWDTLCIYPWII